MEKILLFLVCFSLHLYSFFTPSLSGACDSSLQKYVREQVLLAVAVIVKRGSLDKSIDCKSIFHEVGQLITSGNPTIVSTTAHRYYYY